MAEITSSNSELLSEVEEASSLIREIGASRAVSVKGQINFAARHLGWGNNRAKDVWYEDARVIKSHEMDQLRRAKEQLTRDETIASVVDLCRRLAKADSKLRRAIFDNLNQGLRSLGAEIRSVDVPSKKGEGE